MKACVIGYGAMGKLISEMLGENLACNVALECDYKTLRDVKEDFDCIIDFSNPANLSMILDYENEFHKPIVFATTGYTDIQLEQINNLSKTTPVLRSANFSLGVILLNRLVKEITPILKDDFDIEVVEAHHNKKVDAPSGTAKMLLKSITDETGYKVVAGRDGIAKREKEEVGIHSLRGGTIVGEHEVLYCGNDEILTLKHSAHSKRIFATGAIKAAFYIVGQEAGYYDMEDVLFGKNK